MATMVEIYNGFQLTAVEQPDGRWMVEIIQTGGGGKPFLTQTFGDQAEAMGAARRYLENRARFKRS